MGYDRLEFGELGCWKSSELVGLDGIEESIGSDFINPSFSISAFARMRSIFLCVSKCRANLASSRVFLKTAFSMRLRRLSSFKAKIIY